MWVGKRPKGQNLYCKDQRGVSDEYRRNYDAIKWDTYEKNTNHEPLEEDKDGGKVK